MQIEETCWCRDEDSRVQQDGVDFTSTKRRISRSPPFGKALSRTRILIPRYVYNLRPGQVFSGGSHRMDSVRENTQPDGERSGHNSRNYKKGLGSIRVYCTGTEPNCVAHMGRDLTWRCINAALGDARDSTIFLFSAKERR